MCNNSSVVKCLLFILLFMMPVLLQAQGAGWDVYMAQYEKGAGSTVINMELRKTAPVKGFSFVLVTGVTFKDCTAEGMPSEKEFNNLYLVSDKVKTLVANNGKNYMAGTFTYQCQRLDYYYVADTIGLREKLAGLYSHDFAAYQPYINIKQDEGWKYYLDFLYPNEETQEYMENEKVVLQLIKAGDKLDKARQVDHWLYFAAAQDRDCFIAYASQQGFKVEDKSKAEKAKLPFKLQISRVDKVDVGAITGVCIDLKKAAKNCKGKYDGWESVVVK